ncbi:MAG: hypothetical protein GX896_01010 [Clostridiales bacterium]|nr:hypothetical protein [Clostridiales bacterium]
MKLKRILAAAAASVLAVSALATSAFASSAVADENLVLEVSDLIGDCNISEVYGARLNLSEDSKVVIMNGAGGGFIFSTKSNNWNQLSWCNGCTPTEEKPDEEHDIQYDEETNSVTRMEEAPFFTETDISGDKGEYSQIAVSKWWGEEFTIDSVDLLAADGAVLNTTALPIPKKTPVGDSSTTTPGGDSSTTTPGTNSTGGTDSKTPGTGIAGLAMVTIALAGASVVATKKRK